MFTWLDTQVSALHGLNPSMVLLAVLLFMAMETTLLVGILVPADAMVLVATTLLPGWGDRIALVLTVVAGSLIGETVGYLVGRSAGGRVRRNWAGRRVGEHRWQRAEDFLGGRGARSLIPVRFVGVVHAITPVVAGAVRMPMRRFLGWSLVASSLWAICFVSLGITAGAALERLGTSVSVVLLAALAVVVGSVLGLRALRRRPRSGRPDRLPIPTQLIEGTDHVRRTEHLDTVVPVGADPAVGGSGRA